MRIRDWSSDVCASDLAMKFLRVLLVAPRIALALTYFIFPGRLVAFGRWLLRRRAGLVQKSVMVDGRAWPYLEGGDPAKPTLVLVHGFAGDKDNWPMLAAHLRAYHVIADRKSTRLNSSH